MTGPVDPAFLRKRTGAALLLAGAVLGLGLGALDRAHGVPPSAAAIFSQIPSPLQSGGSGQPAAVPATSTAGTAGLMERNPL